MRLGYIFFLSTLCVSCSKYYLSVNQQWIDANYLASVNVGSPDPRRENPPLGQMLIIDWRVPQEVIDQQPEILLDLIFWDYTTTTIHIPVDKRMDYTTYKLLNDDYHQKGGILTYKATLVTGKGEVFRQAKHQLWVNLITVDEEVSQEIKQEDST